MAEPICIKTGFISGHHLACGECEPCSVAASPAVRDLLRELHKALDLTAAAAAERDRLASIIVAQDLPAASWSTTPNPHMLPKVRSQRLMQACGRMPCTLRLSGFLGLPCASQATVVGAHTPIFGKGTSTKVSDHAVAAGCELCHRLLDQDPLGFQIREDHPQQFWMQLFRACMETQARWIQMGEVIFPGAEIVT